MVVRMGWSEWAHQIPRGASEWDRNRSLRGGLEEGGDFVGHEVHLAHEGLVGFDAVADEVEYKVVEARVQVV